MVQTAGPQCQVLLTDLDNTLYDWLGYWVPSFRAMVVKLSELTGTKISMLMQDFAHVFQRHGTVEFTFALEELDVLAKLHPDLTPTDRAKLYWDAVVSFQQSRRRILRLYPGIFDVLATLRAANVPIYGVTESMGWHMGTRLRSLGIDSYFTAVYARPEHWVPSDVDLEQIRRHPVENYKPVVETRYLPADVRKPNPALLESILHDLRLQPYEVAYLGDSLYKDVSMARNCGVRSIWARYGSVTDVNNLRTLVKVTPWSAAEVDDSHGVHDFQGYADLVADSPSDILEFFWQRILLTDSHSAIDGHLFRQSPLTEETVPRR